MTRMYELMVVLRADFDGDNAKKREDLISKLLGGTKVKDSSFLGKKTLAYPIRKQKEACYVLAHVEADRLHIGDVEKLAKLEEPVLRFLLTVKESYGKQKSQ